MATVKSVAACPVLNLFQDCFGAAIRSSFVCTDGQKAMPQILQQVIKKYAPKAGKAQAKLF
jgi:hypothetical protein